MLFLNRWKASAPVSKNTFEHQINFLSIEKTPQVEPRAYSFVQTVLKTDDTAFLYVKCCKVCNLGGEVLARDWSLYALISSRSPVQKLPVRRCIQEGRL